MKIFNKKIASIALVSSVLLLGGCSQKNVEIDMDEQTQQEQNASEQQAQDQNSETSLDRLDRANQSESDNMNTENTTSMSEDEMASQSALVQEKLDSIYFGFDQYSITQEMRAIAKQNAQVVQEHSTGKIKVEGNCDEWGTDEYNYALGLKRAKTAKDALIADGVASDRILMVSYGESNPVCTESNVACWKKNRRVDYKELP